MNILVTGASGFIGKKLCFELTGLGHHIFATSRRFDNIFPEGVTVTKVGEIDANTSWKQSLDGVDVIFHLAGRAHVMNEKSADPLGAYRLTNVEATLNLAKQASEAKVKRFIFLSSIKVNGESTPLGMPYTTEDCPMPLDPYGISKHEAEKGLLKIAEKTQMEVVIIRPPLVYGPNVKANFLNMMNLLALKVPLPFAAVNKNRRSLVSLDNLINFLILFFN
jgi:nucleoside-diphosphate-sugar epimerase